MEKIDYSVESLDYSVGMWNLVEKSDNSVETLEKVDYSAGKLDYFVETFDLVAVKTLDLFECDLVETLDLIDWVAGFVAKKFDLFVYYLAEKLEPDFVEKLNFAENYFAGSVERHYFGSH